ncbi:MAG: signal peptidase I [Erysipelotrichaceae bacterium]|jgi:signal peptidase
MKIFKKICSWLTTVIVVCVFLVALFLVGTKFAGIKIFSVISGSMEPAYRMGSLIFVKPVKYTEVKVGDAITFVLSDETIATHRVIAISDDNKYFSTQGDANDFEDGNPVYFENLIGVPVFTVPVLGYVANFIQRPPGSYITIIFCAAMILLVFLPDFLGNSESKEEKSAKKLITPKYHKI